jgi:hypothetical protein
MNTKIQELDDMGRGRRVGSRGIASSVYFNANELNLNPINCQ